MIAATDTQVLTDRLRTRAIFSESNGGSNGIGFAIPSEMVRRVVESAVSGTRVVRPWLGAQVQPVTQDLARSLRELNVALNDHSREPGIAQCSARSTELASRLDAVMQAEEHEGARSVELTQRGFTMSLLPFDIAARFAQ